MTPKQRVLKRYPSAWYCNCGCGGVYNKGYPLTSKKHKSAAKAWDDAARNLPARH